ncbi:putative Integral membrane protein [Seiridium unicorne]|uniref:Integral membrane protein n=1 Tax=Seiridium unicorne TaxID=138068 RepID=A0ABR2UM69_9PEZI
MMDIDPTIQAIFGPLPSTVSLYDSTTMTYDVVSCIILAVAAASVVLGFYS